MKKTAALFLPILGVFLLELLALGWAALASGQSPRSEMTLLSAIVAALILVTGLLPAFVRPSADHTLVACFAVVFAFFIVIPFEFSDLPTLHPGIPTFQLIGPYLLLRLVNASILLPMAVHVTAFFPRRNPRISKRALTSGYVLSFGLAIFFLLASVQWTRISSILLLFLWFTFVIGFFLQNLLTITRDATPENSHYAQQARIVLFSVIAAETPLWLRPLTLAFGLDLLPYNLILAFQLFIPAGITYAVLRHDLFGIDRILRRTLAYGAVSLTLLTLYLAITTGLTELFATSLTSRPLAPLVSLIVAAILFEPARRLIQTWLDRLLYPDRLKFLAAVQATQTSLARANRRDQIVRLLTEDFPAQIGAEWGALRLFPEPDMPPAKASPPAWHAQLTAGSVGFGGYWLGPRRAGPQYDSDESNRLHALASQAALALAYANAYESLYELNQQLETRVKEQTANALESQQEVAAYQERQKIARDLHDSVTQNIFGLHLSARGLKKSAPEAMKKDLGELEQLAGDVLREMRLLLDQLRNAPAQEAVDLTGAIQRQCEALARRTGPEGGPLLTVQVDAPARLLLPATIADEALWVVREALQNVIRHSESRTASCTIRADDSLRVTIEDAGRGFDAQSARAGHYGLRGMRERVLALGGEFKLESETGRGTILSFRLPLPK
jgi:signal transduction histidine kinase